VLNILKDTANDPNLDTASDESKAVQLFQLINDTITRNKLGIKPLKPHLARITEINSIADIQTYLEETLPKGGRALFSFGVSADAKDSNKNVPQLYHGSIGIECDYYLKDDEDSKKIKAAYTEHVAGEQSGEQKFAMKHLKTKCVQIHTHRAIIAQSNP